MNLKNKINSKSRMGEIIRFGLVGGFATLLQYAIYLLLVAVFGLAPVAGTVISYAISFIFNFLLSTFFTFKTKPTTGKGIGFAISHLINLGLQTLFVVIFKGIVGPDYALLPALAICIPVNYILVRFALTSKRLENKKHQVKN